MCINYSRRRRGRRKGADAYLSLLASNGQVIMDPNTGLPLYSPYTDEERKAYRYAVLPDYLSIP